MCWWLCGNFIDGGHEDYITHYEILRMTILILFKVYIYHHLGCLEDSKVSYFV